MSGEDWEDKIHWKVCSCLAYTCTLIFIINEGTHLFLQQDKCELRKIDEQFLADELDVDALVVEEKGIKRKVSDKKNVVNEQISSKKRNVEKGSLGKATKNGRRYRKDKIQKKKWPPAVKS